MVLWRYILHSTIQNSNKPVTPMSDFELEILWQKNTKRFGFIKEEPEYNVKLAKRLWDINHSRWEYYLEHHDELMIQTYRRESDMQKNIEINLLKKKSPIFQEENKAKIKIFPFEDENEFYHYAEPWEIKRNDSPQKIEGTLIMGERNTRERLSDIPLQMVCERENFEKFYHDLVEIDKLQWYLKESSLQPFEVL